MWRSREATASALVLPVGRPTRPSGFRHGATRTSRVRLKNGSARPLGALLTTWRTGRQHQGFTCLVASSARLSLPGTDAPKATTGVHRSRLTFSLLNRLVVDLRGRPQTYWRKAWDSNPRRPERPQQFSRLSHSSALAAFRRSRLAVIGRPGYEQVVPSSGATSDSRNSWTIPRTQSSPR